MAAGDRDVLVPTVMGPVTGGSHGFPYNGVSEEFLDRYGYVEEEFFIEGEATAYEPVGELTEDGRWTVAEESTAPYTTRILVRRPADAADFDGSVLVEWFNVSAGRDSDPDFGWAHEELLRSGSAYVGVSAQQAGVEGAGFILPTPGAVGAPKEWDPERYEPISHPGDQYSYDIFSQAAQALRQDAGNVLGGLEPEVIMATGQSQSAARMAAYANAVQPVAGVYDGLMVHSRGAGAATLVAGGSPIGDSVARIRDDLDVPVLQVQTESELGAGFNQARQDDTDMVRTWEVAGTAHVDYGQVEYGEKALADRSRAEGGAAMLTECPSMNQGPHVEVMHAAVAALRSWAAGGEPPPSMPPLETDEDNAIVRDELGNALGGVRTPAVDAPIAAHSGTGSAGGNLLCGVFGASVPFAPETLAELYPTHQDYVDAVIEAANAAVEAGSVLRVDADALIAEAEAANVPPVEAPVPAPEVTAAPEVGEPFKAAPADLAAEGVREDEYLFSGATSQGDYTSRMIVRRPEDPGEFNGSVIVEAMSTAAGFDLDADFQSLLPLITEEGYAYVGVTSEKAAVEFLRGHDPERYGSLAMADKINSSLLGPQPASYEVFAQAGMALSSNGSGVDPLGGLEAERLIALGQGPSAHRLTTFIDRIHGVTLEPVYDGFLPHAGGGAPERFPAPVFKLNSENEAPGYFGSRDTEDPSYRYWEVPGTAQTPLAGIEDALGLVRSVLDLADDEFPACPFPFEGPGGPVPIDPVLRSAVVHLDRWVESGEAPPKAPLIEMTPSALDPNTGDIQRDWYGNARGGIRMPQQEAPTGRNTPSSACGFTTLPQWDEFNGGDDPGTDYTDVFWFLEPDSPKAVYRTHNGYVWQFAAATWAAESAGYILPSDSRQLIEDAAASDIAR